MSLLFISRHMKVIQNALLYNKIECYNTIEDYKEVPLSLRGCTHSSQSHLIPSTGCVERCRTVATVGADCTMVHDVKSPG